MDLDARTPSVSRRRLIGRIVFLVVTLIALYFVLPGVLATFDALPRLRDLDGFLVGGGEHVRVGVCRHASGSMMRP